MKSSLIGGGDGQNDIRSIRAPGTGYGSASPSLPEWARHFDPLMGPARGGMILPTTGTPITQTQASYLNKWHNLIPTGPLPPNESETGAFIACVEATQTPSFSSWIHGERGRIYLFKALLQAHADHSDLEIGLHDIADCFGSPGINNTDMAYTLLRWAKVHPVVRSVLDGVVQQLRDEGRIPLEVKS